MYKFQTLIVWKKGTVLVQEIFKVSKDISSKYHYSLKQQLLRAALSITNNIAEGSGRLTQKDKRHFYIISQGSLLEVVNMLFLIKKLGIIESNKIRGLFSLTEEIAKMLYVIIKNMS